jgi:hypothetical protein
MVPKGNKGIQVLMVQLGHKGCRVKMAQPVFKDDKVILVLWGILENKGM